MAGRRWRTAAKLAARSAALVRAPFAACIPRAKAGGGDRDGHAARRRDLDADRFDLDLDASAKADGAVVTVAAGNHSTREMAHAGTSLDDYAARSTHRGPLGERPGRERPRPAERARRRRRRVDVQDHQLADADPDTGGTARRLDARHPRVGRQDDGSLGETVATTRAGGTAYALRIPPGALSSDSAISIAPTSLNALDPSPPPPPTPSSSAWACTSPSRRR